MGELKSRNAPVKGVMPDGIRRLTMATISNEREAKTMAMKIKSNSAKAESFLLSFKRALYNGRITLGDYYKKPSSAKLAAYDALRSWYTSKNARIIAVTSANCYNFTLMALVGSTLYVETRMHTYQVELPTYEVWN